MWLYGDEEGRKFEEACLELKLLLEPWGKDELIRFCAMQQRQLAIAREQMESTVSILTMYEKDLPNLLSSLPSQIEYLNKAIKFTEKGIRFSATRPKGSTSAKTQHIRAIVAANPRKTAKELHKLADKSIIGDMPASTFANQVSQAKKLKP